MDINFIYTFFDIFYKCPVPFAGEPFTGRDNPFTRHGGFFPYGPCHVIPAKQIAQKPTDFTIILLRYIYPIILMRVTIILDLYGEG